MNNGIEIQKKHQTIAKKLLRWFLASQEPFPWRMNWKKHRSPYHVWVSEIMLQQTVIKAVIPKYNDFIKRFPNVESLAAADENDIRPYVAGLGYYRRFDNLHRAAKIIATTNWPNSRDEWLKLPGIGPYTSGAISSIVLNEPVAAVDGNVERVYARVFGISQPVDITSTKRQITELANLLVDKSNPGDFNQALMELGQKICRPTSARCNECPIAELCHSLKEDLQDSLPIKSKKIKFKEVTLNLFLVHNHKNEWLLINRPEQSKFLSRQPGFLTAIQHKNGIKWDGNDTAKVPKDLHYLGDFSHAITNHKLTVKVYRCDETEIANEMIESGKWFSQNHIGTRLIASLDKKAWKKAL